MEGLRRIFDKNSIHGKLLIYNCAVFFLVLLVVVICNVSNLNFIADYNASSEQFRQLSLYYSHMREANISLQNYCYSLAEKDMEVFQHEFDEACGSVESLQSATENSSLKFRFGLLRNMADTYKEHFTALIENAKGIRPVYSSEYEYLLRLYGLIDRTSSEYFNLVTDDMMARRGGMIDAWKGQICFIALLVCFIVAAAVCFSFVSARSITKPIGRIVKNIQKIKRGEYDLKEVKGAGREFAILCGAFDDMAVSVRDSIAGIEKNAQLRNQLLETENENLRMKELLTDTELKALQGQINPHFLFNTLSMISKMAYIEGAGKTSELMEVTSELLRYSLDKASRTSTLYEEMDCVRNYFYIQRLRFGQRVGFEMEVEDGIPDIKIPGMIIQPIIENAVIHGVNGMTSGAIISVEARYIGGVIQICIEDNGKGMNSETIEAVMADNLEADSGQRGTNIGIYNVKRRLEMFYGGGRLFHIDSSEGCGTLITISIEVRRENGDSDV